MDSQEYIAWNSPIRFILSPRRVEEVMMVAMS